MPWLLDCLCNKLWQAVTKKPEPSAATGWGYIKIGILKGKAGCRNREICRKCNNALTPSPRNAQLSLSGPWWCSSSLPSISSWVGYWEYLHCTTVCAELWSHFSSSRCILALQAYTVKKFWGLFQASPPLSLKTAYLLSLITSLIHPANTFTHSAHSDKFGSCFYF